MHRHLKLLLRTNNCTSEYISRRASSHLGSLAAQPTSLLLMYALLREASRCRNYLPKQVSIRTRPWRLPVSPCDVSPLRGTLLFTSNLWKKTLKMDRDSPTTSICSQRALPTYRSHTSQLRTQLEIWIPTPTAS